MISYEGSKNLRLDCVVPAAVVVAGASLTFQDAPYYDGANTLWEDVKSATVTASTAYVVTADDTTETFTAGGAITFAENQAIVFSTTGTMPAPLVAGTTYYAVSVNGGAGTFEVALTSGGSAVDLTTNGSGTISVAAINAAALMHITLNVEVTADQPYMPLRPHGRVVATTGAGDSVTISDIRLIQGW